MDDDSHTGPLTRRALVGGLGLGAALSVAGCGETTQSYKFRIDLGLLVDGVPHSASTTRSATSKTAPDWMPTANTSWTSLNGTAASVDVGRGRVLFLTLYGYSTWDGSRKTAYGEGERKLTGQWLPDDLYRDRGLDRVSRRDGMHPAIGRSTDLLPHELPAIVIFEDSARPETGNRVRAEDLSTIYPELALARCTLSFPRFGFVSRDPEIARMQWLDDHIRRSRVPGLALENHMDAPSLFVT